MQKSVGINGKSRMQVAAETLYQVLSTLQGEEKIHAGVLFYGHRVGWNQKDPDELLYQQDWSGEIPPNLLPLEDVELVLSPGPIDDSALKQFASQLANVRPWGETPLYLSLVRAAALVDPQSGGETHVVAITDGADNQRQPKDLILTEAQMEQIKTRADVLTAASGPNAKIDLLGFEMDGADNAKARSEFLDICTQTGGAYYPAVSADALLSVLQEILGPSQFSVSDRSLRNTEPIPFGRAVDLKLPDSSPQSFGVSVDRTTEQVLVRGGERVRMYFDRKTNNLFVKPYRKELVASKPFSSKGDVPLADIKVGFHSPRLEPNHENRVRFRCSLSSDSQRFVSRPASVLVRVRALNTDGSPTDNVWYAFNPLFAADVSVPVVEFVAEEWPQECSRARVELWTSWQDIKPEQTLALDQLMASSQAIDSISPPRELIAKQSPEANGTYFLIEKYSDSDKFENPFLMQVAHTNESDNPVQWTVRHRFDPIQKVHLQEMIPDRTSAKGKVDLNIELTSFDLIRKHSQTTAEPMELEVLPAGTILQPTDR